MKEIFRPNTDEREGMIVLGILTMYFLVAGFVVFLYLLHRISLIPTVVTVLLFTLLYLPRLLIINKLRNKDRIKVLETSMLINQAEINFEDIKDFRVIKKKPSVVFVFNNSLIVYQEAEFHLLTSAGEVGFKAIGSEKIELLTEFLNNLNAE